MTALLRSEVRKVLSTHLWWLLALVMAAYMGFMAAVLAFGTSAEGGGGPAAAADGRAMVESIYTIGASLGYVFPLVIGALAMTGEFRHRTITPTLLAEPRRGRVLAAKLLVQGGVGAAYGVVGTAATVGVGAAVLLVVGEPTYLDHGGIWVAIAWSVVALALWGVVGVGLGTVLPNQIASVVVILAFTQFVEPILRIGLGAVDALAGVGKFLPGAAAEALIGSSFYSVQGMADLLDRWQGALVMLAYVAVFALLGRFLTLSRDVT